MRLIRSKNTKPELALFKTLSDAGIPFAAHVKIGDRVTVDALVHGVVAVFVDSPFWHLRDLSELQRLSPYWCERLLANRTRDRRQDRQLRALCFTVVRLWADEIKADYVIHRLRVGISRASRREVIRMASEVDR